MAHLHLRRLRAELADFEAGNGPVGITIEEADDLQCWKMLLVGAEGTIYEGERYTLRFRFANEYPIEAPEVVFEGEPPVNEHVYSNGHICLSILYDQWSPALTVSAICLSIQSMLSSSKAKGRPVDNDQYVQCCRDSPKKTIWQYHGEHSDFNLQVQPDFLDEC